MSDPNAELLAEIEAFLRETGIAPTRFGQDAVGEKSFMIELRRGRDLRLSTVAKVKTYMERERRKRAGSPKRARRGRAEAATA